MSVHNGRNKAKKYQEKMKGISLKYNLVKDMTNTFNHDFLG